MACRGMFYALTEEQASLLFRSRDDEERIALVDRFGEEEEEEYSLFVDKAWDALHRCLTNGTLRVDYDPYPLCKCLLGGVSLYDEDTFIISFVSSAEAREIALALVNIDKAWLLNRYLTLEFPDYQYGEKSQDDFEYTWEYFEQMNAFYQRAAAAGRDVIFTADQ